MSSNISQLPAGNFSAAFKAFSGNPSSQFPGFDGHLSAVQQGQLRSLGDQGQIQNSAINFSATPVEQGKMLALADQAAAQNQKVQPNSTAQSQQAQNTACTCPSCCGTQSNTIAQAQQTQQTGVANNSPNMFPNQPVSDAVSVKTEVVPGLHGRTRTIHDITIRANYSYGNGVTALPGETIQQEAARQAGKIENVYTGSYKDALGNEVVYRTRVDMTVNQPSSAGRMNIVIVANGDPRLQGDNFTGQPLPNIIGRASMNGTSSGNAYVNATASTSKTVPHEVGHLLGFRHTYETVNGSNSCASITPGQEANLMSQSGCVVGETNRINGRLNVPLTYGNGDLAPGLADFSVTQSQFQQLVDRHKGN